MPFLLKRLILRSASPCFFDKMSDRCLAVVAERGITVQLSIAAGLFLELIIARAVTEAVAKGHIHILDWLFQAGAWYAGLQECLKWQHEWENNQ